MNFDTQSIYGVSLSLEDHQGNSSTYYFMDKAKAEQFAVEFLHSLDKYDLLKKCLYEYEKKTEFRDVQKSIDTRVDEDGDFEATVTITAKYDHKTHSPIGETITIDGHLYQRVEYATEVASFKREAHAIYVCSNDYLVVNCG